MIHYQNDGIRRQDRLLDQQAALALLRDGEFGVLSMIEGREEGLGGYGIPLNYVWDGCDSIYFHCAPSGHKLECLDLYPMVSFTVVGKTKVISHQFTTAYESIVVRGTLIRELPSAQRMDALVLLLDKYSPNDKEIGLKYTQKSFRRTEVLALRIEHFTGKTKRVVL